MDTISLYELNSLVSHAIEEALPDLFWVEAELMEAREVNGHCYMELVQKDIFSATPVARASAKCWRSQWQKVGMKFRNATGEMPSPGMKLLVRVKVEFHPTYGYALIVSDVDPTYTIGDMARKRREILSALELQGVLGLQKELELPLFCQRIAVISSSTAAGYGDFCNQLACNNYGIVFKTTLFQSVMQGAQIEDSMIAALDEIALRIDEFDCVVIIRGGGAVADMSGFDTLRLAENVVNFPLPIITGIGHDRDECVLDIVSHQRVKTPTAAAAFLVERMASVAERIDEARDTILSAIGAQLDQQKFSIERLSTAIMSSARLRSVREQGRVENLFARMIAAVKQSLLVEQSRLKLVSQVVNASDPNLLLKKGYTMTMADGKVVKDASLLRSGQEIETIFVNGKVTSIIK